MTQTAPLFYFMAMKTKDKKMTADTILEESVKIKVGWFRFKVRPLTFGQIWEMSVYANDIKKPSWGDGDKINIFKALAEHGNDARLMNEVFIKCAFRKTWKRWLWGRYIRKNLDIIAFNELVKFVSRSFNANFFLTSITFLTQVLTITEPLTTPPGQQSEE